MRIRALLAVTVSLLPAAAAAQVPGGPEFQVNTYTTRYQMFPSVAALAGGDFMVAWTSGLTADQPTRIMGRRFGPGGRALGDEVRLGDTPGYRAQILPRADGGFVVVWASRPDTEALLAQRYDAQGDRVGAEILLDSAGVHLAPTAASNAAGDFVVAWVRSGDVHALRVDSSGTPVGSAFQVNATTSHAGSPSVAVASGGAFVVAWERQVGYTIDSDIAARRFTADGDPLGGEFLVNTLVDLGQDDPVVAMDAGGGFLVVWLTMDAPRGVAARRFGPSGEPLGAEFRVAAGNGSYPALEAASDGTFLLAWDRGDVFGTVLDATGAPLDAEFQASVFTPYVQQRPAVAAGADGAFFVVWESGGQFFHDLTQDGSSFGVFGRRGSRVQGTRLDVDAAGNRVLEPGETVAVAPSWLNLGASAAAASGTLTDVAGPPGATYSILDAQSEYGTLVPGVETACAAMGDCYSLSVLPTGPRPALHWDFNVGETLTSPGGHWDWRVHVGGSFTDVATASPFYPFVETLLHHAITGGCASGAFCPVQPVTRAEMAAFLMAAREGPAYKPVPCVNIPFGDVPLTHPFCRFIRYLATLGIAAGCGGGNYCPDQAVSRQETSVLVLRTSDPTFTPPPCTTPVFADVPAASPFCPWIEEWARRGIAAGCGGGRFCPAAPVTREQMAVFIAATFRLQLYGP
jgi:hypothetical protein